MKLRMALLALTALLLLLSVSALAAQDATPEPTPETTAEPQSLTDLFASLPQSRTTDGAFVVGDPSAPITVIEFYDYACPHCQEYRPIIEQVLRDYLPTGQMQYELRMFPTAGGRLTVFADQAVECAEDQRAGSFWRAYELLYGYATSGKYTVGMARLLSDDLDLNYAKLVACTQTAQQVLTDVKYGDNHGVGGTPAILVRYGDGPAHFIKLLGQVYDRGGVPYGVLSAVIQAANHPDQPIATEAVPLV